MSDWWISVEMLTDPDYYNNRLIASYRPWMRVTLYSHRLEHPECSVIDHRDVRSINGRNKAVADFTFRMKSMTLEGN